MESHNFEAFVAETIEINYNWAIKEKDELPIPIEEFWLWSDQGRVEAIGIVIKSGDQVHEIIHGDLPPEEFIENDELLVEFCENHDLDPDEYYWGDYFGLPESLYRMEMIKAAKAVAERLQEDGVEFSDSAEIGILIEDEPYDDENEFRSVAFQGLAEFDENLIEDFLSLYYAEDESIEELFDEFEEWRLENDEDALELPEDFDALMEMGMEYFDHYAYGKAIPFFQKAHELEPHNTDCLLKLSKACLSGYHHEKAILYYEKLLQLETPTVAIYYNLGHAYKENNEPEKAIESYKKRGGISA